MTQPGQPLIITCDAGGTMTDVFIVDEHGRFSVGKASTTPRDESIGYWESLKDALGYWGRDLEADASDILGRCEVAIYSGTAMLNTLLQRNGVQLGVIITRGFEDYLVLGRGRQTFAGYSYNDRLHTVTHHHPPPLVQRRLVRGVTERIDMFGQPVIPLYEHEVRQAAAELIELGAQGIVISFLFSFANPAHEVRARAIVAEVLREHGADLPVYTASDVAPTVRELSRLSSVLIQGYAAEPARANLLRVEAKLQGRGFRHPLQVLLAYGGLAGVRYDRLYETVVSGPVGGLLGAKYLGEHLGLDNLVTADMGGTSFDVGLITRGKVPIIREPEFAGFVLNLPMVGVDSIGAGAGSYLKVDALTHRIEVGPESAGADPGPVCYDAGNTVPTVLDCNLILGIVNPDYYMGGKMKLNRDKALAALEEHVARPMGLDVYVAAAGIVELVNTRIRESIKSMILAKGFSAGDYTLVAFGGAGPVHMASYTAGIGLKGVITVPFAAGFSAFGCATVDYLHRYQKSVHLQVPPQLHDEAASRCGQVLNEVWAELDERARRDMMAEGFAAGDIRIEHLAYVRYAGQIDDLEVVSPVARISSRADLAQLIDRFETQYGEQYATAARFPQAGFQIFEVAVVCVAPKVKPRLQKSPLAGPEPPAAARKGERQVFWQGHWQTATLYEMDELLPGNAVRGLAVVEAPSTTIFVPDSKQIVLDDLRVIWLRNA